MPSGFVPNKNFPNELEGEPEYQSGLAVEAGKAAAYAKSFAPVRTGAYRDSIGVVVQGRKVYLSAKDWKANFIEFGTATITPSAPLRRGARAAGLRFKEESR